MEIIKKRKILTKEEEARLFGILGSGAATDAEKKKAEETLVLKNMGLVVKEARRYASNQSVPMEDLLQEGVTGLVRAIRKFDPALGRKFSTYATWWVKRDIGRMIRTSSDVIHVPEHTFEAARIAKAAIVRFEAENGRPPTDPEFEKISGMTRAKAEDAFKAVQKTTSIHTPVGDDTGSELGDLIEDQKTDMPDDEMARREGKAALVRSLRALPKEDRTVLALRYGVMAKPMSVPAVAETFGVPEDELAREAERLGLTGEKKEAVRA